MFRKNHEYASAQQLPPSQKWFSLQFVSDLSTSCFNLQHMYLPFQ